MASSVVKRTARALPVLRFAQVGHCEAHTITELGQTHFAVREHDVEVDDDRHSSDRQLIVLAQLERGGEEPSEQGRQGEEEQSYDLGGKPAQQD